MTGRAGFYAIGDIPSAHGCRIAATVFTGTHPLAWLTLTALDLEAALALFCCSITADCQTTTRFRIATTAAAIFAHVVEATQFTAFVRGTVPADITG